MCSLRWQDQYRFGRNNVVVHDSEIAFEMDITVRRNGAFGTFDEVVTTISNAKPKVAHKGQPAYKGTIL